MAARPLLAVSLSFVLGAGLGGWLPQEPVAWGWAAAALLATWAVLLAAGRLEAGRRTSVVLFVVLGILRCQSDLAPLYAGAPPVTEMEVVAVGRIAGPVEERAGETLLRLEGVRLRRDGGGTTALALPLQVAVAGACERYAVGDVVVARGSLRALRGDRNLGWFPAPVVPTGSRFAARLTVSAPAWVRRVGHDPGRGPEAAVLRWRAAADRFWDDRAGAAGAILNALTTGERADIPREVQDAFTRSGLTHLLAISGMNVGALAALVFLLLRRLLALWPPVVLRVPAQPLAAALTLPSLWFFLLFSGGQIPVGRAVLSCGVVLAAALAWRRAAPAEALTAAALAIVVADPRALFSASFQLSFAATAALLLAAPRFAPPAVSEDGRRWTGRLRHGVRALVVASLAATVATVPLVAFHFQQVSLVGPAANLIAVPLTGSVVLPAAWLSLLAAALPQPAADLVVRLALMSADALIAVARWCAAHPWATVASARPPALLTLLLLALAGTLLPTASRRLRAASAAILAAAAVSAGWWAIATHSGGLSVAFLDVGQGLAVVARLPGGETLLYDAGPRWRGFDAGERIVVPALRGLGVWRLNTSAISHGHPDHAGGIEAVRAAFPAVRSLDVGSLAGPGSVRDFGGGARLRLLTPGLSPTKAADENDRSLALLLGFGETGFVFTGDAGPSVAAGMIVAADRPPGRLVLQAPHHGGSPEACRALAEALRPSVSVISVGRNTYGHPRPGAEAALAEQGRVLRTDREGAVFIHSDGVLLTVRTWRELSSGRSWPERVRWLASGW